MAISEQDKLAIDAAVKESYFISTDEYGNKSIDTFYVDYRDTNEFLLQKAYDMRKAAFQKSDAYEPENALLFTMQDMITEVFDEQRWDIEDAIIRKAGFEPSDDMAEEQLEYLRDTYSFEMPFDHYFKQSMKVNIMLDTKDEANSDFVAIYNQREAMIDEEMDPAEAAETLSEDTGLKFLVEQQGHTMEELKQTMAAYRETFYGEQADHNAGYDDTYAEFTKSHNPFLASVCQELDNMRNYMSCMTILAKVDMYEFAEMMNPGKEISFGKDAMIGIYSPWNGGGSVLEIELEKELVVPSDKIWDVQIEGVSPDFQYSVDSTYGLIESCWKEVKSIKDAAPQKKPSLDSMIQAAQNKLPSATGMEGPSKEVGRD